MTKKTRPAPPEGVHSDFAPPETQAPAQIQDALARFDAEVEKARGQPSRAMQALKLAELVEQKLPEDLRMAYAQLKYEVYPKEDGGLKLQIDARRNPHALNMLVKIRHAAEDAIRAKRHAIEVG